MKFLFCLMVLWAGLGRAEDSNRFVKNFLIGTNQCVAIAAGDGEPMDLGSYTVRLYNVHVPEQPNEWFLSGQIRPRDGYIDEVVWKDVDGDGRQDIIVIIRCSGSGAYPLADAFKIAKNEVKFLATTGFLARDADCVAALKKMIKNPAKKSKAAPKSSKSK